MKEEFNWRTAVYPCIGEHINDRLPIVCFSSYGVGHNIRDAEDCSNSWHMEKFKPYTQPKQKTKLWYWEYLCVSTINWHLSTHRMTEKKADKLFADTEYRKLEALGFIEED